MGGAILSIPFSPYLFVFFGLGLVAAFLHNVMDGGRAVGASGAINGVVGMYLVFFPRNNVSCLFWFFLLIRTFSVSSIWIILLFVTFDVYGASTGGGQVAYWAHLGGFGAGFALASGLLYSGIIEVRPTEESIYDMISG